MCFLYQRLLLLANKQKCYSVMKQNGFSISVWIGRYSRLASSPSKNIILGLCVQLVKFTFNVFFCKSQSFGNKPYHGGTLLNSASSRLVLTFFLYVFVCLAPSLKLLQSATADPIISHVYFPLSTIKI